MGSVGGDSTWASDKYLTLAANADLEIKGSGRVVFSDGGVTFDDAQLGDTVVTLGATVLLTESADRLITDLEVGEGTSSGTVELGGLSGNVMAGGNIVITPTGTFKMTQTGDLPTAAKGSLLRADQDVSFTNQGTFLRTGTTTGLFSPQLDYVVTNTGVFRVEAGSILHLTRQDANNYSLINQSGGTIDLYWDATVRANANGRFKQEGGTFQTRTPPESGYGVTTFQLKGDFLGGSVHVGVGIGYGKLDFGNNDVKFGNSTTVYLDVDGNSPNGSETGDQIVVGGASQITIDNTGATKPTLVITTDSAQPAMGWQFDVMIAPNLVGTFDQANVSFLGFSPPGGYTVSYPFGPPRSVRLTA
jgi:hypothetical protein